MEWGRKILTRVGWLGFLLPHLGKFRLVRSDRERRREKACAGRGGGLSRLLAPPWRKWMWVCRLVFFWARRAMSVDVFIPFSLSPRLVLMPLLPSFLPSFLLFSQIPSPTRTRGGIWSRCAALNNEPPTKPTNLPGSDLHLQWVSTCWISSSLNQPTNQNQPTDSTNQTNQFTY